MVELEAEEDVEGDEGEESMEDGGKKEPLGDLVPNDELLASIDYNGWD